MGRKIGGTLLVFVLFSVLAPQPVYGYIDPLSGSIILQVLAAGLLGASITIKRFRWKIMSFFRSFRNTDHENPEG